MNIRCHKYPLKYPKTSKPNTLKSSITKKACCEFKSRTFLELIMEAHNQIHINENCYLAKELYHRAMETIEGKELCKLVLVNYGLEKIIQEVEFQIVEIVKLQ